MAWTIDHTLAVSILGGISALIGIKEYFRRASIKIDVNRKNSMGCRIESTNERLGNKLAILLYAIRITGKGTQPAFLRDVSVEIKHGYKWVKGINFIPTQKDKTDGGGVTKSAVHIRLGDADSDDHIYIASWNDFKANQEGLRYGEPATFCVASYFEIGEDFKKCRRVKIRLTNFLGHKYTKVIDDPFLGKDSTERFLIQE